MIVKFHPPTPQPWNTGPYYSSFDRGQAQLIINTGHGEYDIDEEVINKNIAVQRAGKLVIDRFAWYDMEDKDAKIPKWVLVNLDALVNHTNKRGHSPFFELSNLEDTDNLWGTISRITGPVSLIWSAFYQLSNKLDPEQDPADYTPGGDDDTFDYYPSAFEALEQIAEDLDHMDSQWPTDETSNRFGKLARRFSARHRIEGIVRNLQERQENVGQTLEDIEFEGHAAPYLSTDKE